MEKTKHCSKKTWIIGLFIIILLLIDQVIKFLVKTNMMLGGSIHITNWFYIYFTENPGMAFGWEIFNKSFLSIFRIVASIFILWATFRATKDRSYSIGFLMCMAAIFSGAFGNIIDSVFYGVIFDSSYGHIATLFPAHGGYAGWLHGRVVDMFYFPLIEGNFPSWLPYIGGDHFIFFRPIFNFADSCIFCGVVLMMIFYAKSLSRLINNLSYKKANRSENES